LKIERKTEVLVAASMTAVLLAWMACDVFDSGTGKAIAKFTGGTLAYAIAAWMAFRVASEHRQQKPQQNWMKIAWLAMGTNALIFIFRPLVETHLWDRVFDHYSTSPLEGFLLHVLIIPANCFFLVGVLAMWKAFAGVGLGFKIKTRDYLAMASVMALMFALMFYRQHLSEAQSPILMSRVLQPFGLALLSICAAMSLVLYRLSMQMGGGTLAVALRWLAAFALLRGSLVLLNLLKLEFFAETIFPINGFITYVFDIGWQLVPWTLAFAATCRAEMTVMAARELRERRAARGALASV